MTSAIFQIHKYSSSADIRKAQAHDQRKQWRDYALWNTPDGKSYEDIIQDILDAEYNSPRTIRKDAVRMVQAIFIPEEAFFIRLNSDQQRIFNVYLFAFLDAWDPRIGKPVFD